jgi:hypothetical protein
MSCKHELGFSCNNTKVKGRGNRRRLNELRDPASEALTLSFYGLLIMHEPWRGSGGSKDAAIVLLESGIAEAFVQVKHYAQKLSMGQRGLCCLSNVIVSDKELVHGRLVVRSDIASSLAAVLHITRLTVHGLGVVFKVMLVF